MNEETEGKNIKDFNPEEVKSISQKIKRMVQKENQECREIYFGNEKYEEFVKRESKSKLYINNTLKKMQVGRFLEAIKGAILALRKIDERYGELTSEAASRGEEIDAELLRSLVCELADQLEILLNELNVTVKSSFLNSNVVNDAINLCAASICCLYLPIQKQELKFLDEHLEIFINSINLPEKTSKLSEISERLKSLC